MHCRAGLGRTGTLIALWMMRGTWKAREAIAWLRIVRPGSVLGIQQEYLEACEDPLRSGRLILDIDIAALLNEVACMYVRMYVCMSIECILHSRGAVAAYFLAALWLLKVPMT